MKPKSDPTGFARALLRTVLLVLGLQLPQIHAATQSGMRVEESHEPSQPKSAQKVQVKLKIDQPVAEGRVELQVVEPGHYVALADKDYASNWRSIPLSKGPDGALSAEIPAETQKNRHLIRYRYKLTLGNGQFLQWPATNTPGANLAYFVYDGIPAWKAAVNPAKDKPLMFSEEVMRQVQAYQVITKMDWVERATWKEQSRTKDYKYTGTFVADGKVYDHVRLRARGGDWRHAMGKNMWKFDFNKEHPLEAKDDYGQPYRTPWAKLNLRACIQQGDYGHRGEQGMFEAVGFRLFNLAGVAAPRTHWVQLRFVTGVQEAPANQYDGDFWGLYLAIENEDGRFLTEHELPDGNVFKMMYMQGELSHHGAGAVTNLSDIQGFVGSINGRQPEEWWRKNVDLTSYYGYRSVLEAIHHYDLDAGKNYDFYFNPKSGKWVTIPWDIDLTWADNMYGGGREPFSRTVLSYPNLRLEYQNRLTEIRDLLYNPEQTGALIDECARIIHPGKGLAITDADRAKWDYHPIMISRWVVPQKAGQGLFYGASRTGDFAGMVELMKNYVRRRATHLDRLGLSDRLLPATPKLSSSDHRNFRMELDTPAVPLTSSRWRVAEVAPATRNSPGKYEITPTWESPIYPKVKEAVSIPPDKFIPNHRYRARARVQDQNGRWSHWSAPIEWVEPSAETGPREISREKQ